MLWCEHYFVKLWISGSFSFVASVNLPLQMAALCNRQSSCCERISISAAAETSSTSFPRSRYSRTLLLSLNAPNTVLAPDVCKRLWSLDIYDRNQACPLWKRQKRSYGAGFIHRGKTVDTIKQKNPLSLTLSLRMATARVSPPEREHTCVQHSLPTYGFGVFDFFFNFTSFAKGVIALNVVCLKR